MTLDKLFYLQGVGDRFIDCSGSERAFSIDERLALLCGVMGLSTPPDEEAIARRIDELDARPWLTALPAFQFTSVDAPAVELQLPQSLVAQAIASPQAPTSRVELVIRPQTLVHNRIGTEILLRLPLAEGAVSGDYLRGDERYLRLRFSLPPELTIGEYQLVLRGELLDSLGDSTPQWGELLLVPERSFQGGLEPTLSGAGRPWGLGIGLFYLRSTRQWGIGDFADLASLIVLAAGSGCDFITLTPLHAPSLVQPSLVSPYSPSDRRLLNPLHIAIDDLPEYAALAAQLTSGDWLSERLMLNQRVDIDYPRVALLKYRALARLFGVFNQGDELSGRSERFEAFIAQRPELLSTFCQRQLEEAATLKTLAEFGDWQADPVLARALQDQRFFAWLQFVADEQLALCQLRCRQMGMRLGLVRDLAVGALGQGSEVNPGVPTESVFCAGLDIGAPPDPFAPQGQNWGMPPFDPVALRQTGFKAFRRLCRDNMRHCGALRLDHVMAMSRIWCWRAGDGHPSGCYLHYPADALLAILVLESHLSRCVLIGEDLGTVPEGLRDSLKRFGILGNDLLYFCRDTDGFIAPARHRTCALMQLGNQDVAPFLGWWRGLDLALRESVGLNCDGELPRREADKLALLQALWSEGCLPTEPGSQTCTADGLAVFDGLLHWAGRSHSGLLGVSLWDVALETRPVNIPGTHNEYPNWHARLSQSLESLWQSEDFRARLQTIDHGRRGLSPGRAAP